MWKNFSLLGHSKGYGMRLEKLTKEQRERIREQRKETQLIVNWARARSFEYVVNPPEIPRVCFGSGMERVTLPLKGPGLSSFMRSVIGEVRSFPGPLDYEVTKGMEKEYSSKLGFTAFVSKLPRLPPTNISPYPPTGAYDLEKWIMPKQCPKPFNSGTERLKQENFLTPGPPTYPHHLPGKKPRQLSSAFGSRRVIWPEVAVFCSPYNTSKCYKCNKTPYGDYWHNFSTNLDMCRPCMKDEQVRLKQCSIDTFLRMRVKRELGQFHPVRYCGFFHNHNGTTAAMQLIPTKQLRFKIKQENYLKLYMD